MDEIYLVFDRCDCDDPDCYGKTEIAAFTSMQTARQEAELRSRRWGGHRGRPEMHMQITKISRKVSGF